MWLLAALFRHVVSFGQITVIDTGGVRHSFAGAPGPAVTVRLMDDRVAREVALNPRLKMAEAYVDGRIVLEDCSLYKFLEFCCVNIAKLEGSSAWDLHYRLATWLRRLQQINLAGRAARNVAHHYDLSDELYRLFLDDDRQYSCAYFESADDTLEQAQENKKRHLAAKLLLKPGCRVLDIGSGWGGLGLYLAQAGAGQVTGITLSQEQHKASNARAAAAGVAERVRFDLRDYRDMAGQFERIVSVGMFEHVGVNHYGRFFDQVARLLTEDGVAVLHSIGRSEGPGTTNPWLRKYIFPGGYSPALSEVLPAIERAGLIVTDIEILRLHYAETLREWRERFEANREHVRALYDERFCRMWEFYLIGCEFAFRYQGHMVFQIQMAKRGDTVPITRAYIDEFERAHRAPRPSETPSRPSRVA